MIRHSCRAALLLAGAWAAAALAAPAPHETTEILKDRAGFIPQRKYQPLPGKAVGVLVGDVQAMMGQEGRGGPQDAYGFSRDGNSYRWMYVPYENEVLIQNLTIPIGEKGEQTRVYPKLNMARPITVKQWDIDAPVCLVEVEVNDQSGSPAIEGFVATKMRRLDGTEAFPAKLPDVVADVKKRQARHMEGQRQAVLDAFADLQKTALKGQKFTGPRETAELYYITWLPERERLRVSFRTTLTDGAYQQGGDVGPGPFGRPVEGPRRLPPARPPIFNARWGTQVSVELGVAYEVTKNGKIDKVLVLPLQASSKELPAPPLRGPRDPRDLPAQPIDR